MSMNFITRFKRTPQTDYSLSVAATWAGAGSIIVGTTMVRDFGVIPFLLWAAGNILACIVFGLLANRFEYLRKVFTSKAVKIAIGLMCIFQLWVNMSGVHDSLTLISPQLALIATYAIGIAFVLLYLKFALIRNVLADSLSWKIVYVLIIAITVISLFIGGINIPSLGIEPASIENGIHKLIALLPGAFFYPCFWALFAYNNNNRDGVSKVNMEGCFIRGGLLFGAYLAFVFVLGITAFPTYLNAALGVLIAIVAASSLTSFIYSIYSSFGTKVGVAVNTFALAGWYFLISLGVMGAWTLMADCRLVAVIVAVIAAIVWMVYDKKIKRVDSDAETQKT